jgi:sulfatase maturation enzyme AslB (radical SAM superfamily)
VGAGCVCRILAERESGRTADLAAEESVGSQRYGQFLVDVFEESVRHDVGEVFVQVFDTALAHGMGMSQVGNYLCRGYRRFFRHIDEAMRMMAVLLSGGVDATGVPDRHRYDPADPAPAVGGVRLSGSPTPPPRSTPTSR